jgi:hypothetical protein
MVVSGHIGDLVENAIEKSIIPLDVIINRRRDNEIKWDNLGIQNESDFLNGQLFAEILYDFANNYFREHKRVPDHTEILEAYKIIMGRADDFIKAITDIEFRSDTIIRTTKAAPSQGLDNTPSGQTSSKNIDSVI